ncbi:MAG: 2-dehydropantoate 2-reductase [Bacteroidetes bacterium]|nr:2-dehydropantoate 2-reductase [Bacteroidota bacterium]
MDNGKQFKVGIIGMGPVGMILAAKLKEAGCEVAVCVRNEVKFNKIKKSGVFLENVIEYTTTFDHVCRSISEMASLDLDYLVFALKSYQTTDALSEAEILNSKKLVVISAQNGIDVEQFLIGSFGESKTLRMVVNYAGNLCSPNTVRVTFFTPPNYIGSIDDSKTALAKLFAEALNKVDLKTQAVDSFELLKRSWEKTILNSALSPLCGVGRLTMAEAMADPDTVELIEQTINEGIAVAEKEKIRFTDNFLRKCLRYLKKGGDHFPSLAGDVIKNHQTEIDFFNGKIVEYGKKHYVRTTLNLAFTNIVKAMTNKNIVARIPGVAGNINKKIIQKGMVDKNKAPIYYKGHNCFLGIDLGSAYTKFTLIDEYGDIIFRYALQTLSKDREAMKNILQAANAEFDIKYSCATGYGRKVFTETDIAKTEINCATTGVSKYFPGEKNIIDIGGEDIKIIRCDQEGRIDNFYMNDKCAAGTGSFLTEIADRAEINISEMGSLAEHSAYDKELNSFCTVFAKTEIMKWIMEGMSIQDIARGIYISIANKVAKMRLDPGIPTLMIGGVIAHHPYLKTILSNKFNKIIEIVDAPQYVVSLGASLIAQQHYNKKTSPDSHKTKVPFSA